MSNNVHQALGELTRQLHDALNGLGLLSSVQQMAGQIPDARDRLSYIANVTGNAAEKVLNIVDLEKDRHRDIQKACQELRAWTQANPGKDIPSDMMLRFTDRIENDSVQADANMTDIMIAQDFHDLTTQVVTKVIHLTQSLEQQLVKLVVDTAPAPIDAEAPTTTEHAAPSGPAINPNSPGVVSSQSEVDDLLASLGF